MQTRKSKTRTPKPKPLEPTKLSPIAQGWFDKVASEYNITDSAGLVYLNTAARAMDRADQAAAIIARDGLVAYDRWGTPKPHPACGIERAARAAIMAALKGLNLDIEPLRDGPGRPGHGYGV